MKHLMAIVHTCHLSSSHPFQNQTPAEANVAGLVESDQPDRKSTFPVRNFASRANCAASPDYTPAF